jgi:hypothetical protein
MRRCFRKTFLEKVFTTLRLHIMGCEVVLLGRDTGLIGGWAVKRFFNCLNQGERNMKRLFILGILLLTAASTCGCRWCGWGRQGDVCNACSAPGAYPTETYYGGEVYGSESMGGAYYNGQVIEGGLPMMPVPEALPSPAAAR